MFHSECEKYNPDIFNTTPLGTAFDLADGDAVKLDYVLDMPLEDAQKLSVLKAKRNFMEWFANKKIMEENQ